MATLMASLLRRNNHRRASMRRAVPPSDFNHRPQGGTGTRRAEPARELFVEKKAIVDTPKTLSVANNGSPYSAGESRPNWRTDELRVWGKRSPSSRWWQNYDHWSTGDDDSRPRRRDWFTGDDVRIWGWTVVPHHTSNSIRCIQLFNNNNLHHLLR